MIRGTLFAWLFGLCLFVGQGTAAVIITEIHYDPDVKTQWVEFVEIYNDADTPVDLSGWQLTDAVSFTFPNGSYLDAQQHGVIAQDLDAIQNKWAITSYFPCFGPYIGRLSTQGETVVLRDDQGQIVDEVDYQLGFPWPTVGDSVDYQGDGHSIQLINYASDNDLAGSWRSAYPTPDTPNSDVAVDNTPPHIRQVKHQPQQPVSGQPVLITAKVTDDDGVARVELLTQRVEPGQYFPGDEVIYDVMWSEPIAMHDDGLDGDEVAGDGIYSIQLEGSQQTHRLLMRYRINIADSLGNELTVPYEDDPQPNFAYFVYDGVPAWQGAARPGVTPEVTYDVNVMSNLPVYHLISRNQDVEDCTWNDNYSGSEYKWWGTLVVDGEVYDHIRYRARGGVWRYAMGKNMWKFDFNRGHYLQARDDLGQKYDTTWDKLNFSACIQQGDYLHRGEHGLFEAASFRMFNLLGVPAPKTHWLQFRIIDEAAETGSTQFEGDFWGLYLAIEQMDGRFLDEHGLADGNLYKMEGGSGDLNNQGATAVTNKSDLNAFMNGMSSWNEQWWLDNVDMDCYYGYRCVVEGVHHGDIGYGKNYFYYLEPDTQKWSQLPWDLDLSWAENMYGNGREPFISNGALNFDSTEIAYKNRMREFLDLLYNPDQMGQLLDELAAIIWDPNGGPSMVDADRAMWDYNPVMRNSSKAGQGRFYESSDTGDFAGMVQLMKDYVDFCISNERWWWRQNGDSMGEIAADSDIPETPEIVYAGSSDYATNDLIFSTSDFSDPQGNSTFAALRWRLARVEPFSDVNAATVTLPDADGTLTLIDDGETWSYFKGTSAPAGGESAWTAVDYDDSSWSQGLAPVGYGEDFVETVLSDMRYNYSTVYLRKTFTVDTDIETENMTLEVMFDDAVAVYLNGYLFYMNNVDVEDLTYDGLANGNNEQTTLLSVDWSDLRPFLVDGTNVLAVHLLNLSVTTSSDCFFDARLTLDLPQQGGGGSTPTSTDKPIVTGREGYYEIDTLWDSNDIPVFADQIQVPATVVEPNATYRVRCRMQDNTGRWSHWSAPVQFTATDPVTSPLQDQLRITEIMFNPRNPQVGSTFDNDDFEFIELTNISNQRIDLSTLTFTGGIDFDFSTTSVSSLAGGATILLVKSRAAFNERYGTVYNSQIAGEYDGQLSNSGETLALADTYQGLVLQFDYDDNWHNGTDGDGYSLELIDPQISVDALGQANSWQASANLDGSPGSF